jgi:glycosyltransferase involved in cell wall biosynthesis
MARNYDLSRVHVFNAGTIRIGPHLKMPTPGAFMALRRMIRNSDIVYCLYNIPSFFLPSVRLALRYKKKLIYGVSSEVIANIFKDNKKGFQRKILDRARLRAFNKIHYFKVENDESEDIIRAHFKAAKAYKIEAAVPVSNVEVLNARDRFVALFVGRLSVQQKGLDFLKEIVDQAIKLNGNINFEVIGSGYDGEGIIESLAESHKGNFNWIRHSSDDEKFAEIKKASLFVFPSRYEEFGLALCEAQAFGLPAVAFDIKGPRMIMKEKIQGRLVEKFDVKAFAEAVADYYEFWKSRNDEYFEMKKKISETVIKRFGIDSMIPRIIDMLEDVSK